MSKGRWHYLLLAALAVIMVSGCFADTVDSLNAIEQAVFIDKKCSFDELIQALSSDFEGHEKLHAYLVNKAPKYGRDDDEADAQ